MAERGVTLRPINYKPIADPRFRAIPEPAITNMLLMECWAFEIEAGHRALALTETSRFLDACIDQGLGFGFDAGGQRLFDPVEVVNFMKWMGLTQQHRFWADHYVKTWRAHVEGERLFDTSRESYPPQAFQIGLRRTFDLHSFATGSRLRLRAPVPMVGDYLRDLSVITISPSDSDGPAILRDGSLEVRLIAGECRQVTIGADFSFLATVPIALSGELCAEDRDLYLRPVEGFVRVTPRVAALAAKLAEVQATAHQTVAAFWSYIMDNLICGAVRYAEVPPLAPGDWVLDHGWFDCQLGSALLVSLCRARGIPARILSGHFLYHLAPTHHYWSEIWFDDLGWLPFDVLSWDLSMAGDDPDWRKVFAGRLDYRLVTQRLPITFTGPMSVRFPEFWQMLQTSAPGGVSIDYRALPTGSLIYTDCITIAKCS